MLHMTKQGRHLTMDRWDRAPQHLAQHKVKKVFTRKDKMKMLSHHYNGAMPALRDELM